MIWYCWQKGWVPLSKSDNPERIAENANVYDFELTEKEMETLYGLDRGGTGNDCRGCSQLVVIE
jgi:diketogulonate reductase-like aldo/keto reductase